MTIKDLKYSGKLRRKLKLNLNKETIFQTTVEDDARDISCSARQQALSSIVRKENTKLQDTVLEIGTELFGK